MGDAGVVGCDGIDTGTMVGAVLATTVALLGADVGGVTGLGTTGAGVGCPHRPHSTIISGLNVPISFTDDIPKQS